MADATALQLVEEIAKGLQVSRNVNVRPFFQVSVP